MKSKSTPRAALRGKLAAYSSASAAALAAPALADAQTVTNITAASFTSGLPSVSSSDYADDLRSDSFGIEGFNALYFSLDRSSSAGVARMKNGLVGEGFAAIARQGVSAAKLTFGQEVAGFGFNHPVNLFSRSYSGGVYGNFVPEVGGSVTGYVGFKQAGHYGWFRMKVGSDESGLPSFIGLYDNGSGIVGAFGDNTITAGQYNTAAVPEPASVAAGLGLFALGAAGIREHRRRKLKAA